MSFQVEDYGPALYWIWLVSLNNIGPVKAKFLLDIFGEPENIWNASYSELSRIKELTPENLYVLTDKNSKKQAEELLNMIYKNNIFPVTIYDKLYPENLKKIYDPPIVIFKKGSLKKDELAISIVGSRKATPYGLSVADTISYELSKLGITIVSGMARGIDSRAHEGALRAGGRTIAVLGCGLDNVYPYENRTLMDKISHSGAVISEYLPGVPPLSHNFPARNRIISGLTCGVIIVEAGEKSGSLITTDFALEQGREVFAVPGNIFSASSKGTNKLIRDGAKIITDIDDILEELKNMIDLGNIKEGSFEVLSKNKMHSKLNEDERKLADCFKNGPLDADALSRMSGMNIQTVNSTLVVMEIQGFVEQLPGNVYMLKMTF